MIGTHAKHSAFWPLSFGAKVWSTALHEHDRKFSLSHCVWGRGALLPSSRPRRVGLAAPKFIAPTKREHLQQNQRINKKRRERGLGTWRQRQRMTAMLTRVPTTTPSVHVVMVAVMMELETQGITASMEKLSETRLTPTSAPFPVVTSPVEELLEDWEFLASSPSSTVEELGHCDVI